LDEIFSAFDKVLDKEGIVAVESSYLFDMLDNLVFDFIYHEHLSYLCLSSMAKSCRHHGFRVFDVERVNTKGGSMRYLICRQASYRLQSERVAMTLEFENVRADLLKEFTFFEFRINKVMEDTQRFLETLNLDSKGRLVGFGASATSTTLLHAWNLGGIITLLVDDNPLKQNTYSPGYQIPVRSVDEADLQSADVVIILAWRFKEQILERLLDFKGLIICPLPRLEIFSRK